MSTLAYRNGCCTNVSYPCFQEKAFLLFSSRQNSAATICKNWSDLITDCAKTVISPILPRWSNPVMDESFRVSMCCCWLTAGTSAHFPPSNKTQPLSYTHARTANNLFGHVFFKKKERNMLYFNTDRVATYGGKSVFLMTEIKYFGSQICGPREVRPTRVGNILSFLLLSVNRADSCREMFIWLEWQQLFDDP